ncbi:uncharacterized protein TA18565 [Theileria annulata]|uniref:BING4 C-terminal domain-containing protein n=1 Tax=Theileria annulata TaxID=5874 RepID=Q4UBH5_THEAN|nr:uncharacterized protein TA18565 [Theileria annulata]CAI75826.1 hypothetical protein, conserved [Theileria annulata]|eukprot:XP_955302.1 hypothetical protein, conserved [Theileria annulata]
MNFKDTDFIYRKFFGSKNEKRKQSISNKKVQKNRNILEESRNAVDLTSILLPNEPGYIIPDENEKTYELTQTKLLSLVDQGTKNKALKLNLPYGPYFVDFSANGRYLLLGGEKGQLSLICTQTYKDFFDISVLLFTVLISSLNCRSSEDLCSHLRQHGVRSVYLKRPNGTIIYLFLSYSKIQITNFQLTYKLEYLYYHYLLVTVGEFGDLCYQDISTGEVVAKHNTKKGPCKVMCQNKNNAVIHLGHNDGLVSLYVPNMEKVTDCSYDDCLGFDGYWKVWDLRNYKEAVIRQYVGSNPPTCATVSQTGILSLNIGSRVEFYNNVFDGSNKPNLYLKHHFNSQEIKSVAYQPYEDVCAVGTTFGMSNLIIPGSGYPNFDALEHNPYETGKIRKDREVQRLLEKLPADSITLNAQPIGSYSRDLSQAQFSTEEPEKVEKNKETTRKRPIKSSAKYKAERYNKVFMRRQQAVEDKIKSLKETGKQEEAKEEILTKMTKNDVVKGPVMGAALSRFFKKK